MAAPVFGIFFTGHSYPIGDANFTRVDQTHWVLDVCTSVRPDFWSLKEVALFLAQPGALDPHLAVGLYVRATTTEGWQYRGCVHGAHPSEVMPLQWPHVDAQNVAPGPGVAQVGVSVEPLDELLPREGSKLGAKEQFAKRVGMDLYRFLESFQVGQQYGDQLLIPANALDRWLIKFSDKFRRDPDFLTREQEKL